MWVFMMVSHQHTSALDGIKNVANYTQLQINHTELISTIVEPKHSFQNPKYIS